MGKCLFPDAAKVEGSRHRTEEEYAMARIKIEDLPEDKKIEKEEMKMVHGGLRFILKYSNMMWYANVAPGMGSFGHGPHCTCPSCND